MNLIHVKFTFSLLLTVILPLMGMNESDINKNCQFTFSDIQKIAETDIDKGILLETHLKNLKEIESYSPLTRKGSIDLILGHNFDKQQKLMGLIECASFTCSPAQNNLINYGFTHKLIPKELLEGSDNTVDSFYKIKNVYDIKPAQTLQLVKKVLPSDIENITEYPIDNNFDPITNDIKTIKYKRYEKMIDVAHYLIAYDVTNRQNNPFILNQDTKRIEQRDKATKAVQKIFAQSSLPNKIALILRLQGLNNLASNNMSSIKNLQQQQYLAQPFIFKFFINAKQLLGYLYAAKTIKNILTLKTEDVNKKALSSYVHNVKNALLSDLNSFSRQVLLDIYLDCGYSFAIMFFYRLYFTPNIPPNPSVILMDILYETSQKLLENSNTAKTIIPSLLLDMYKLYQWYTQSQVFDPEIKEMKKEQKNIQNLIEEFKDSIKKEYSL